MPEEYPGFKSELTQTLPTWPDRGPSMVTVRSQPASDMQETCWNADHGKVRLGAKFRHGVSGFYRRPGRQAPVGREHPVLGCSRCRRHRRDHRGLELVGVLVVVD